MYFASLAVFFLQSFLNARGSLVDFLNEATFKNSVQRSPHFVLFYAPWCGHCKSLLSSWNLLAEKSHDQNERGKVKIAKVNCMEDTALCSEQNILAYPTMKLFHKGVVQRFDGKRSVTEFEIFIDKALKEEVDVEENEGLVTLTAENFDAHIKTGLHFVEFYAPWCVHCQRFEPTWRAIAKHFQTNPDITICKVDCTVETSKCQELRITGFPMLKLYKDGVEVDNYNLDRRMETLLQYISSYLSHYGLTVLEEGKVDPDKIIIPKEKPNDDMDSVSEQANNEDTGVQESNHEDSILENNNEAIVEPENDGLVDQLDLYPVVELIDVTFDMMLADGPMFVMFYVPWCKHCQNLKPTWETLGKRCQIEGGPTIARMDCSKFADTCTEYQVSYYPTLALFKGGKRYDYNQDRKLELLFKFAKSHHDEL